MKGDRAMPGLRENIEDRLSPELTVDEEFAGLIPQLSDEEYQRLERSILSEGCREAIIVWHNTIIDGHNRYRICRMHDIPYRIERREFVSDNDAKLWMLNNQLGRRNLTDFQRIEMVRKCEDVVKARAKERQLFGLAQNKNTVREKLPERAKEGKRATEELGEMAGVSRKTYEHAVAVLDNAPEAVIEAVRKNELSIDAAYKVLKLDLSEKEKESVAYYIKQGCRPYEIVNYIMTSRRLSKNRKFTLSIAPNTLGAVRNLAEDENKSVNAMLCQLINEALAARKNANRS